MDQFETIQYLVENKVIKYLTRNGMGKTAVEILNESPPNTINYLEMKKLLTNVSDISIFQVIPQMSKSIMVVVILIATMAFQSATSPAGGVWSEDDARHSYKAGKAVMASTHPYMYKKMTLANTMAFICSLTVMYLFTTRIHVNNLFFMMASWTAMLAALLSITITYIASVYMITPDEIMHSTGNKILLVVMLVLYGFGLISMFVSFVIQLHQSWDNKRRRQLDLSADAFPWRVFYWIFQQMEETRGHFQMFQR